MITTINCSNCSEEGRFPYRLTWVFGEKTCETCHHYEKEERKYCFCSENCLKGFVDAFVGHEHNWIYYSYSGVLVNDKGEGLGRYEVCKIGRYEVCKICDLMRFNKDFRIAQIEALRGNK